MICNMCPRHETCPDAKNGCEKCDIGKAFKEERKKLRHQMSLTRLYHDSIAFLEERVNCLRGYIDQDYPYASFWILQSFDEAKGRFPTYRIDYDLSKYFNRAIEIYSKDKSSNDDIIDQINLNTIYELASFSKKYESLREFLVKNCYLFEDMCSFEFIGIYHFCVIKDNCLYDSEGNCLSSSNDGMDEGIPYFVNQTTGYLGDDYYGTLYIRVDKTFNIFVAVRYAM